MLWQGVGVLLCCSLICCSVEYSTAAMLTCHQRAVTCPGSPVSCECQGFVFHRWFAGNERVLELSVNNETGVPVESTISNVLYHGVVCSADTTGPLENRVLVSRLNFTFTDHIDLMCVDVLGPIMTTLQKASHPSVPLNLTFTQISIATDSFTVKLNWDPPQNDGGLPIANYFIFINGSQEMGDTSTNVTLMLNSTEEYVISISAVNECGLVGNTTSMIVAVVPSTTVMVMTTSTSTTGTLESSTFSTIATRTTPTTEFESETEGSNMLQTIVIGAGVAAIVLVIVIIIAIVVALLRRAGRSRHIKVSGDNEMIDGYSHFDFNKPPENGTSGTPVVDPRIEDEYSVLQRQSGPQQEARGGAQLNRPVVPSEYSVLEQRNGAEPEMIQDYAYCRVGAEPKQSKKTVQYIEVETSTERANRQKEMLTPARNDVQYSAVKVKTHPEDDLLDLNNLLLQLRPVQSKWAQIAKALNITEDRIQHIRGTTSGEDYDCLVEVCDEWLESHRKQDMNPTWRAVGNALNRAGCKDLAKEIKDIYKTGKLPRSPSDDEVTAASASGDAPNSSYDDVIVTSPQKKPAMKPPAELPQYDDVIVTSPQKKPAMKPPAELPQYDDVITSSDAPPPIPPQRFEVQ